MVKASFELRQENDYGDYEGPWKDWLLVIRPNPVIGGVASIVVKLTNCDRVDAFWNTTVT
ncbi:hypothetical protein CVT25_010600 [Psilocybe cyanescens]|uniref:Uncharacterized protein n=1 Tax=Psilocybe cyanescens TaxID=93625 RepID=A0A409WJD2_PSICY|nr:hypothetical protein CVT25_010600 [Psilocybe cyanescens]